MPILGFLALGFALGAGAWGPNGLPELALLLPFSIPLARSRAQAFVLAAGYAVGLLRHTVTFIATWFGGSFVVGAAAVAAYAIVCGSVWCLAWTSSSSATRRSAAMCAAWVVALLPPAAIATPGHPAIGAGYLLPGSGWVGLVIALVLPVAFAWWVGPYKRRGRRTLMVWTGVAACLLLHGLFGSTGLPPTISGLRAMTTAWGQLKGEDDTLQRIADIGRSAAESPGTGDTLAWPESVLGPYDSALLPVLDLEVLSDAALRRRQHIIGMDVEVAPGKWRSQAVAFHPDGSTAFGTARQPAPLALWQPWAASSFVADWTANNVLNLGAYNRVAIIFCYEEYMPLLYLLNEAFDQPTAYLAMSNTWAAGDAAADVVQAQHSKGIALLFGRPYARSVNRPAS